MEDITCTEFTEEQRHDPKVRGQIINNFAPLIKYIAARIAIRLPPQIDLNDLVNAGVIGLIDAIEKFDPDKQIKFKTYAEFRIRGSILEELRSLDWVPKTVREKALQIEDAYARLEYVFGRPASDEEVASEMNITLETFRQLLSETASVSLLSLDDLGEEDSDLSKRNLLEFIIQDDKDYSSHKIRYAKVSNLVATAIRSLPENEKEVISLYYYDELTLEEVGHVLGMTEDEVMRCHTKSILRLRARMRKILKELNSNEKGKGE
jgi:RNA polymerase sigma factor FliA